MILDNKVDFYRKTNAQTDEGKVYSTYSVFLTGIDCNLQLDDGAVIFEKYGITSAGDLSVLYTYPKDVVSVKNTDRLLINGVMYEIKQRITYSIHIEFLLKETV